MDLQVLDKRYNRNETRLVILVQFSLLSNVRTFWHFLSVCLVQFGIQERHNIASKRFCHSTLMAVPLKRTSLAFPKYFCLHIVQTYSYCQVLQKAPPFPQKMWLPWWQMGLLNFVISLVSDKWGPASCRGKQGGMHFHRGTFKLSIVSMGGMKILNYISKSSSTTWAWLHLRFWWGLYKDGDLPILFH